MILFNRHGWTDNPSMPIPAADKTIPSRLPLKPDRQFPTPHSTVRCCEWCRKSRQPVFSFSAITGTAGQDHSDPPVSTRCSGWCVTGDRWSTGHPARDHLLSLSWCHGGLQTEGLFKPGKIQAGCALWNRCLILLPRAFRSSAAWWGSRFHSFCL